MQLVQCEQFVIRAQKRLAAFDEKRVKLVCSSCELKLIRGPRMQTRRRQCFHQIGQRSSNESLVTQLQEERIQLGPRHSEEDLQATFCGTSGILSLQKEDQFGSDTTMAVVGVSGPGSM